MQADPVSKPPSPCPDRQTWADFLLGRVSGDDLGRLGLHLDSCAGCGATLDELGDVQDDVIVGLRLPARDDDVLDAHAFIGSVSRLQPADDGEVEDRSHGRVPAPEVPERIGRFRILEYAGSGGFGVVYRAYDPAAKREVALKVPLGRGPLTDADRRRFVREGWAVSSLNHPNIAVLYEADEEDGVPYLALEYCVGPTLAARLSGQDPAFSFRAAAALTATLADAVHHAHVRRVLHRDIKPSNVILTPRGPDSGQAVDGLPFVPKLTDFGLAKMVQDEPAGADLSRSRAGTLVGTFEYMAPEQAGGKGHEADERTDVHALGLLLYQLLTGVSPFKGKNRWETLGNVQGKEPEPPGRLRRGVPRDLEVICLKCLEKDAERRYPGAALLSEDLRRYLAGDTIRARPAGVLERTWKSARRRPVRALALGAAVVLAGVIFIDHQRLQRALRRAEASERGVLQRLYAADTRQAWQAWRSGRREDCEDLLRRSLPGPGLPPASDPRGFEWHFLRRLAETPRPERTIRAHAGGAFCVRFSPDGTLVATGGMDGLVKLWDAASGRQIASLSGHRGDVNRLEFSPDGKTLVSVGDDRTARLWDVPGRRIRLVLGDHPDRLFHPAFSRNGRLLATGGRGPDIRIWDPSSGRLIERLEAGRVNGLAFLPVGPRLVSAHEDLKLRVWDLSSAVTGHEGRQPAAVATTRADERIAELAVAPDGRTVASPLANGAVYLWGAEKVEPIQAVRMHVGAVVCAAYSPDGRRVATGGRDTNVRVWSADGMEVQLLTGHSDDVASLAFSPDGSTLASVSNDGTLKLWDRLDEPDRREPRHLSGLHATHMNWMTVSEDGSRIVTRGRDRTPAEVRSIPGGEPLAAIPSIEGWSESICLAQSPDARWIGVSGTNKAIAVWDATDRKLLSRFSAPIHDVHSLVFSPDGAMLASGDAGKVVRLWDWRNGRLAASLECNGGAVLGFAFSPDGRTLVTSYNQVEAALWDVSTPRPRVRLRLRGHNELMRCAAFSPDGRTLATGSHDQTIRLWDVASGQARETLRGHMDWVESLAFSPDGRTLVSGCRDGTVKFWQTATGLELLSADHLHAGRVTCASFDASGRTLVTGSIRGPDDVGMGEICIWRAATMPRD